MNAKKIQKIIDKLDAKGLTSLADELHEATVEGEEDDADDEENDSEPADDEDDTNEEDKVEKGKKGLSKSQMGIYLHQLKSSRAGEDDDDDEATD